MVVIGVDPDSKAHGVAVYVDGKLDSLHMLEAMPLVQMAKYNQALVSMEDVKANKFIYARNVQSKKAVQSKIAIKVGQCQQAQTELMRLLDWHKVPYVLHKPQKGNWAKNKDQFELVTKWDGRSNEDTRAAAYFGFLGLKQ